MSDSGPSGENPSTPPAVLPAAPMRWRIWSHRLTWWLLVLAGLCLFVPWRPAINTAFYEYVLHLAFAKHWQFGPQLLATYGPLGFIGLPLYHEKTYLPFLLINIAIYAVCVGLLWDLWRHLIRSARWSACWILAVLLPPVFAPVTGWAPSLYIPFVLINIVVCREFLASAPMPPAVWLPAGLVLATFVLVKGNFALLLVAGVLLVATVQLIRGRAPWLFVTFATALVALWPLSGQRMPNLPDFVYGAMEVISGYKDAMAFGTPASDMLAQAFGIAAALLLASFTITTFRHARWRASGPVLMLALTLWIVFQHGFVRADIPHVNAACISLFSLCALVAPLQWMQTADKRWLRMAPTSAVLACLTLMVLCNHLGYGRPVWFALRHRPRALWSLLTQGTAPAQQAAQMHLEQIKTAYDLPDLPTPLDCMSVDAGLAAAVGIEDAVRPTLTMYGAWTPALARTNRMYLEKTRRPGSLLVPVPITSDGFYPTLIDSLSFLAMRTHYVARGQRGNTVVFERRDRARALTLKELLRVQCSFGEVVPVPEAPAGSDTVWAMIDIRPSVAGQLQGLWYKRAPTHIKVNVAEQTKTFRFNPTMGRTGMILSPLLEDPAAFMAFYSGELGTAGGLPQVKSVQIDAQDESHYQPKIALRFFSVMILD